MEELADLRRRVGKWGGEKLRLGRRQAEKEREKAERANLEDAEAGK